MISLPLKLRRTDRLDFLDLRFGPDGAARLVVTTRRGGCSFGNGDLNLSFGTGDKDGNVRENRRRLWIALGTEPGRVAGLRQVHSADVHRISAGNWDDFTQRRVHADGMATDLPGRWLAISIGDCLPIALYDARSQALAMLHAGWRGTASRIAESALKTMREEFGTDPADVYAVIGPGIGPSAYQVDAPVFKLFSEKWTNWNRYFEDHIDGKAFVDLVTANRTLLSEAGVPGAQIASFDLCTHTLSALFFSHRRDGLPGGRMFALGMIERDSA